MFNVNSNVISFNKKFAKNNVRDLLIVFIIINFDIDFFKCSHIFSNCAIAIKRNSIRLKKNVSFFCVYVIFDILISNTTKIYRDFFVFFVNFEISDNNNIFLNFDKIIDDLHKFEFFL